MVYAAERSAFEWNGESLSGLIILGLTFGVFILAAVGFVIYMLWVYFRLPQHQYQEPDAHGDAGGELPARTGERAALVPTIDAGGELPARTGERAALVPTIDVATVRSFPRPAFHLGDDLGFGAGECYICRLDFEEEERVLALPLCSHIFHPHCIERWLCQTRSTCPTCRREYTTDGLALEELV